MVGTSYEAKIDDKGRIILSSEIRKSLGLSPGMKVKLNIDSDRIIVEKMIPPEEFINKMKGFIKKGSPVPVSDPLHLKQIWK